MSHGAIARPVRPPAMRAARLVVALTGAALAALFVLSLLPAFRLRIAGLSAEEVAGLAGLGLSAEAYTVTGLALQSVFAMTCFVVAALLLWIAEDSFAVYSAAVLFALGTVFPQTIAAIGGSWPAMAWTVGLVDSVAFFTFIAWLVTFPDGKFRPQWSVYLIIAAAVFALAQAIGLTAVVDGPLTLVSGGALLVGVAAVLIVRRRAQGRLAFRGVFWAFLGASAALVLAAIAQSALGAAPGTLIDVVVQLGLILAFLAIPLSIAAAVLRRGLWDARGSLARSVSLSIITVLAVDLYVLLAIAAASAGLDPAAASIVVLIVVSTMIHPVYRWLHGRINRALYGDRDDPRAVLAHLASQLAAAAEPAAFVASATTGVMQLLRVPYASIASDNGRHSSQAGEVLDDWPTAEHPLIHQGIRVGVLSIAHRDRDAALSMRDRSAIAPIADQVASLLYAVELDERLRVSHRDLVSAREEERRRLRNDLHDGLGPSLGAVVMGLAAADNLFETDPLAARALMVDARAQVRDTVTEVRRLVYGLRPPALDERGLVAAVEVFARGIDTGTMAVSVELAGTLPRLAAAVEVAAYLITLEAVNNALRHSRGTSCEVVFSAEAETLVVTISDDGMGMRAGAAGGVGLSSMRERAAELGGVLTASAVPGGGNRITAELPIDGSADD